MGIAQFNFQTVDAEGGGTNKTLYRNAIRSVARLHTSPELEKLAIKFLDDAYPEVAEVAIDAATMLEQQRSAPTQKLPIKLNNHGDIC